MQVVQIKKSFFLSDMLKSLPIGQWAEVKNKAYKATSVRQTITRLKYQGYDFEATEKGCPDYIKVRRIR